MIRRPLALLLALVPVPALAGVGFLATPTASSGLLLKSVRAELVDVNVVSGSNAGYVLVIDSNTIPADGAVTPAFCVPLAATTGIDLNFRATPMQFQNGIVVVFSSTGCFTKTASSTAFISGSSQ